MKIDNCQLTISDALNHAQKITHLHSNTPSLDAQVLLAHIIEKPRTWVLAHPEGQLTPDQQETLSQNLSQFEAGTPLPYILGHWEFYGLDFIISPAVLIPRPETELMVEEAIKWLQQKFKPRRRKEREGEKLSISSRTLRLRGELMQQDFYAADIGAGSGCIAVTLAKHIPDLRVIATDISEKALEIARANAENHDVSHQIEFIQSDLLPPRSTLHAPLDLICANLPYIPTTTLHTLKVYGREPTLALDGGPDGLDIIRQLLRESPQRLAPGGLLLLEIDASQGVPALTITQEVFPEAEVQLLPDLAGHDRLIRVET
ncbi:MAG: peptide chain release factor N(5)-glutamine methyltransferase [Anaerolineales bacterium]|nr:peptide chain release factor N(5)-glutamine methyltransferase [Anaerolineales bacterium]